MGLVALVASPRPGLAQTSPPAGRQAIESMDFRPLDFEPPSVQKRSLERGVTVFLLEDHSLPLVTLYARFRGGYALFPRESYASAVAMSGLLRSGGTRDIPPDSVDLLIDFYALQFSFGGGGESTFSSLNTLTRHLEPAIDLWSEILKRPRFDSLELEVWRDRQLESTRRRTDAPGLLAVSEFNRIMFGDHPIGWEMTEEDLTPERLNPTTVTRVHSRIVCPENLILGAVGDIRWEELRPLLEEMLDDWPPCSGPLLEPKIPELRRGRQVFLIPKDLTQSTIVMAKPGGVTQSADKDYFASRIGNAILGNAGFSSRLMSRVRTEMGLAYGVSSFWTTPALSEGIVGATTQTKSESTIAATRLIQDIIRSMGQAPPDREEVDQVVAQTVNSFVFNFQDPSQIVSRQMYYLARGLPEDWLERYVRGIQQVEPGAIQRVFQRHASPEDMIILIVGNPATFDQPPEVLGDVRIWEVEGEGRSTGPPRAGPRFHR
jgi:zinc protease